MSKETVSGEASYWRQKYWAEWGRPPEGPGPHDDRGGPAYIPWLEAKLDEALNCQSGDFKMKEKLPWTPLIIWLIFALGIMVILWAVSVY